MDLAQVLRAVTNAHVPQLLLDQIVKVNARNELRPFHTKAFSF